MKLAFWKKEEELDYTTTVQLPLLPPPLKLKQGPLLVTLELWSDGTNDTYVADLPLVAVYGEGPCPQLALMDLAEEILEFASHMKHRATQQKEYYWEWRAFCELVDVTEIKVDTSKCAICSKDRHEGMCKSDEDDVRDPDHIAKAVLRG